jgi:hypothetical protein
MQGFFRARDGARRFGVVRFPASSIAALLVLSGTVPVLAAGEGSGSSNPDLYDLDVTDAAPAPPRETSAAPFDIDWSVALRGSYTQDTSASFGASLAPEFSLTREGSGHSVVVSGSGELVYDDPSGSRISALRLGADASYAVNTWLGAAGSLDLTLTQAAPDDPSLPANTAIAPLVFEGDAEGSVTQKLGLFAATLRGSLGRSLHGETTLLDSSTIDNRADSDWRLGLGGRLAYEVTPLLSAFVDGGMEWQRFDAPSPSLLVYLDALTYSAKTGLGYELNSTFSAEGAVGLAWRDYADPSLTDAATATAEASMTFKPDESMSLVGSLDTSLAPSNSVPGDSVASYLAAASASYVVNPWVTLRGSADYEHSLVIGTGDTETTATLAAGFDYSVTDHAALTLDYAFSRNNAPPAPVADTRTISLGVRFSK